MELKNIVALVNQQVYDQRFASDCEEQLLSSQLPIAFGQAVWFPVKRR